jgi:hypothetical protein
MERERIDLKNVFFNPGNCSEIRPLAKDVKEYRKCVDPFSKQVISIVLPNLIRSLKRVCVTHKDRKFFFFVFPSFWAIHFDTNRYESINS